MVKDLNYFPLDVESNIYGMTKLEFEDATSKILVATLDCRLYCINYNKFKPQTREVEFTYIPSGAKIISIGALRRGPNDFVIGITHSLSPSVPKSSSSVSSTGLGPSASHSPSFPAPSTTMTTTSTINSAMSDAVSGHASRQTTTYYLNIYASESHVMTSSFDLDHVAQGCQTLRLAYVPYHLYSTDLLSWWPETGRSITTTTITTTKCKRKPVWLLSGGDECLHAYTAEDHHQPYQSFTESPLSECLPELCAVAGKQKSLALWVDVANLEHHDHESGEIVAERAVALGFEDGSVSLYQSTLVGQAGAQFQLIRKATFDAYTTIIPCVRLFRVNSMDSIEDSRLRRLLREETKMEAAGNAICDNKQQPSAAATTSQLNLLVVSSTEESLVFRDVLQRGLDDKYALPESKRLDCVTTATIGDTNASGHNDLLLGTHGKELLTYQYDTSANNYQLSNTHVLNYPIFSLCMLDLTGDGLKDVTVLLSSGILIMQSIVKDALELCRRRLDLILASLADKLK